MPPDSGDDQEMSLSALARRAGVAEATLRLWEKRADRPLRTHRVRPRSVTSTIADLRVFCEQHRDELRAARTALAHLDEPLLDSHTLRAVLSAAFAAFRAATATQLEIARNDATLAGSAAVACRAHADALSTALSGLDEALDRIHHDPGLTAP